MREVGFAAEKLKAGPTRAYSVVRRTCDEASTLTLHEHLDLEAREQQALLATEDFEEGVRAFLNKRSPTFKGLEFR